jgi:hypothetical protein
VITSQSLVEAPTLPVVPQKPALTHSRTESQDGAFPPVVNSDSPTSGSRDSVPIVQRRATQTPQIPNAGLPRAIPVSEHHERTVTVPADVQEAVAAVTGHRPNEVTVRRGTAVDRTAALIAADSYATGGVVHLPGSAPLTSDRSRRLLAHELTHVIQQRSGTAPAAETSPAGVMAERQAMHAEATFVGRDEQTTSGQVGQSPTTLARGLGAQGTVPIVSRSTAIAPDRTSSLPRLVIERKPSPQRFSPQATSPSSNSPVEALDKSLDSSADSRSTPSFAQPQSPAPAPVQRRATHASPSASPSPASPRPVAPSPTPAPITSTEETAAHTTARQPGVKRGSQPNTSMDTARDELWLERHAQALYPHLRHLLRNEFFRDRERRGRLMRED